MNKRLFVLLPIALLTLTGCNKDKDESKSGEDNPGGNVSEIVIDRSVISSYIPDGKTYSESPYSFEVGGIHFDATAGVGVKTSESSGGNAFYELNAMQFKKNAGTIKNTDEFPATKIVVEWLATYAEEAKMYWPKAMAGETTSLKSVTAAESDPLAGTETGKKQVGGDDKDHDAYSFVSTFNLPAGTKYFSVGDSGGATYITKITISK